MFVAAWVSLGMSLLFCSGRLIFGWFFRYECMARLDSDLCSLNDVLSSSDECCTK
jgi:hypothetical protein